MMVSPTNMNAPLIAPSVNVPTEQVTRENKTRPPVAPPLATTNSEAEHAIDADEKRRRRPSWDPAEHPDYELDAEEEDNHPRRRARSALERLFSLLSFDTYSQDQGKGYVMRFRLPRRIIEAAVTEGTMAQRRVVIQYHYGHAVAPNIPSDVLAVL